MRFLCSGAGFFACLVLLPAQLLAAASSLVLKTSDARLAAAFAWARGQALAYAFEGDPVGNWYEAALPGRHAFCMRDTAHQAMGAHVLGLAGYTHNMLHKFAENISKSKDWCSYWEINREIARRLSTTSTMRISGTTFRPTSTCWMPVIACMFGQAIRLTLPIQCF